MFTKQLSFFFYREKESDNDGSDDETWECIQGEDETCNHLYTMNECEHCGHLWDGHAQCPCYKGEHDQ